MVNTQIPKITNQEIGQRIRMSRRLLEMSRKQFAEATGLTESLIQSMELGKGVMASRLPNIAFASGQPLRFFYGEEGTFEPTTGQLNFRCGDWFSEAKFPVRQQLSMDLN